MKFPTPIHEGRLLRRYQRFLADVSLDDGGELTVHCANPGSMTGLDAPGSRVIVSDSGDERRKLRHSLELVRAGRTWVGVNTARTNAIVREALERERIPALLGHESLRAEVPFGERSRVDFLLESASERCFLEVKNATLAEGRVAMFPDAVTQRGLRHLEELSARVAEGHRAVMLFVVNRGDCRSFRPAEHVDPAYAEKLRKAAGCGVQVLVHAARVRKAGITLGEALPAELGAVE